MRSWRATQAMCSGVRPGMGLFLMISLWVPPEPSPARADGWIEPLVRLAPSPAELGGGHVPLAARVALARRLGRHGPGGGAVDALLAGLEGKPPPRLRDAILLSLARRASPRAVPKLAEVLAHSGAVPSHVWTVLAAVADADALELLAEALERPERRAAAARALRRVGGAGVPVLAAALDGPAAATAARTLGRLGPAAAGAVPALRVALGSDDAKLRWTAVEALGRIGDGRAAAPLLGLLDGALRRGDDGRIAALAAALSPVAGAPQAAVIERTMRAGSSERAQLLLPALVGADPARGAVWLRRALAVGAPSTDRARAVLLDADPHPALQPLLRAELRGGGVEGAASALARAGEAGLRALVHAAGGAEGAQRDAIARGIAIGVRRGGAALDPSLRERALGVLRALPDSPRRLSLQALARDATVVPSLGRGLSARQSELRAAAAWGCAWLGDASLSGALSAALTVERDAEVFRRMADAARVLGVARPTAALEARFEDGATGPEALRLAAAGERAAPSRALRLRLRRLLSGPEEARVRVAAVGALATLGDVQAVPALLAALSDPEPQLRLAAARALSVLAPRRALAELRAQVRIEVEGPARAALSALADQLAGAIQSGVALAPEAGGERLLELRLHGDDVPPGRGPEVDVLLDDGRWLRLRPPFRGEILLADLAPGEARVRVLSQ